MLSPSLPCLVLVFYFFLSSFISSPVTSDFASSLLPNMSTVGLLVLSAALNRYIFALPEERDAASDLALMRWMRIMPAKHTSRAMIVTGTKDLYILSLLRSSQNVLAWSKYEDATSSTHFPSESSCPSSHLMHLAVHVPEIGVLEHSVHPSILVTVEALHSAQPV